MGTLSWMYNDCGTGMLPPGHQPISTGNSGLASDRMRMPVARPELLRVPLAIRMAREVSTATVCARKNDPVSVRTSTGASGLAMLTICRPAPVPTPSVTM